MFVLALVQQNSQLLRKSIHFCIEKLRKLTRDRLTLEAHKLPSKLWVTGKWRKAFLWGLFCFWGHVAKAIAMS